MIFPFFRLLIHCLLALLFIFSTTTTRAQVRCATVEHTAALYKRFNKIPQPEAFEKWIELRKQSQLRQNKINRYQVEPYNIPVVVHIIHNGEPVGIGTNVSDEQIFSQIKVLNNDFKRLNADATQTPLEFQSVAGSLDIQFVLAKQDPTGAATTGILRTKGNKTSYVQADDIQLKSQSYWPSESYLNIWVCNLSSILGYAQFPISTLDGLEDYQNEIATTDGVVVTYDAFGSDDDGNFNLLTGFNKGRTLTHEMGHFFGLRHIWGDDSSCITTTDYVADTPKQNDDTNGCPSHPQVACSNTKMFQNYMDYTHDPCMNIFTLGQMERMQIVIENSVRRASLLNSLGLIAPANGANDIALRSILSPEPVSCTSAGSLKIRFQNLGDEALTYAQVSYSLDNGALTTSEHILSPIAPLNYGEITLPISLGEGEQVLRVRMDYPNGVIDTHSGDNELSKLLVINAPAESLPTRERFERPFTDRWTIVNPTSESNWEEINTFYDQSLTFKATNSQVNETSWLVSPVLDFSSLLESNLRVDWAYTNSPSNPTLLEIKYTTDCGASYQNLSSINLLQTMENTQPTEQKDWTTKVIGLEPLLGFSQVRLAFVASAYLANALYLDNIEVYVGEASPKLPIEEIVAIYPKTEGGLHLTFNVEEKQTVLVSIFDMMGRTIIYGVEPNILNQTKTLELQYLQTGIYIVHMKVDNHYYSQKVFIPAR